jgi:hypothetical protein
LSVKRVTNLPNEGKDAGKRGKYGQNKWNAGSGRIPPKRLPGKSFVPIVLESPAPLCT